MIKKHQLGFTLLELLISMAIASLVLLGVSKLYINAKQTSRIQVTVSRLAEDGRFAISMLKKAIEQAGYRKPSDPPFANKVTNPSPTSMILHFKTDGKNLIDCTGGVAGSADVDVSMTISGDSTSSSKLECQSTGVTSNTEWLDGTSSVVKDVSFSYGIDSKIPSGAGELPVGMTKLENVYLCKTSPADRDCVADKYVSKPTAAMIPDIVSIRVCLILRSPVKEHEKVGNATPVDKCETYDEDGDLDPAATISDADYNHYFYRKFVTTVLLRN